MYFSELVFVRDKREKGKVTQKYGASVMIDDRLDVLTHVQAMDPGCRALVWFKPADDHGTAPAGIVTLANWKDVVQYLLSHPPVARAPTPMDISRVVYTRNQRTNVWT